MGGGLTGHWTVHLEPKTDVPDWHVLSKPSAYPFPSVDAATQFAQTHKADDTGRDVVIEFPDGRRWNGKAWL